MVSGAGAGCCAYLDTEYEILSERPELYWFCKDCHAPVSTAVQTDKGIREDVTFVWDKLSKKLETIDETADKRRQIKPISRHWRET